MNGYTLFPHYLKRGLPGYSKIQINVSAMNVYLLSTSRQILYSGYPGI